jgi:hypothetical protein
MSSYYCICVLILAYSHATTHVSSYSILSYYYMCVRIPLSPAGGARSSECAEEEEEDERGGGDGGGSEEARRKRVKGLSKSLRNRAGR